MAGKTPKGPAEAAVIRKSETTGRPLGDADFVKRLAKRLGREDVIR